MNDAIRELTYGHRCEHGVLRATTQFESFAGPIVQCECCRSWFGTLNYPRPSHCFGCRDEGVTR